MPDSSLKSRPTHGPQRGDIFFASFFLLATLLLLAQIGTETSWVKGTKFFAQPRFWPAVGLIGMTVFASLYFLRSVLSKRVANEFEEVVLWLKSLEYTLWFMAYVVIVPTLGYLISTLVFVYALSIRTGYRERSILLMSGVTAVAIVVIFKGFLSVKIPGGQLYEIFPGAIRNFMILYL